jgi:hypothetical protein
MADNGFIVPAGQLATLTKLAGSQWRLYAGDDVNLAGSSWHWMQLVQA